MNRFVVQGFINTIKYLPDSCLVFLDEYRNGYTTSDGKIVEEKYLTWRIVFKGYFKKYISQHFSDGMLVEIDAEMLPYAVEKGKSVEGYSCIGKTIDRASFPRYMAKQEMKMIKDSMMHADEMPNIEAYNEPDF